ncbi:hypothetical protein Lepto7376_3247 [[Leptolyngbya] sp. PCC 7376]|uniref:hypothetical protein n=1 Tax=[Leptolyngbya] sp. PCC 7376 TaxID=111781 RepID=UPI00029F336F|nr:hypothetical protein [[Leptolyngbya] sp. PCC 7376]AFY39475.1 hypothetical protein Lepto7376_3247 [[Leptolyngbya] sp. PCC 7376]
MMDSTKDEVQAITRKGNGNGHQDNEGFETSHEEQIIVKNLKNEGAESKEQQDLVQNERVRYDLATQKKKRQEEETEYIKEKQKRLKQEESLYVSNKSIFIAGAVGGVGSVCIKLIGEDNLTNEVIQTSETQNPEIDWLPGELSQVSFGLGVEFLLYLMMSIFLGALSGFILISMGGISTRIDNRRRCLASAILFGLFFPSSIQLMKQNLDSQITIETQQKEVEELKVKEEDLVVKNAALREESKEAIATLTETEEVQDNPELKQKVLDGYIDVFRNVDEINEQEDLLINIADVGRSNTTDNTPITRDAVNFLELVKNDEQYENSVQEKAEEELSEILMKCDAEQIDCG